MSFASLKASLEARASTLTSTAGSSNGKVFVRRGDKYGSTTGAAPAAPAAGAAAADASRSEAADAMVAKEGRADAAWHASGAVVDNAALAAYRRMDAVEVVRTLRKHGQVVTYFGESDEARADRLARYEVEHVSERADLGLKGGFATSTTGKRRLPVADLVHADTSSLPALPPATDEPVPPTAAKRARADDETAAHAEAGASTAGASREAASASAITASSAAGVSSSAAGSVAPAGPASAAGASAGVRSSGGGGGGSEDEGKQSKRVRVTDALKYARDSEKHKFVYYFFKGCLHEWEDELLGRAPVSAEPGSMSARLMQGGPQKAWELHATSVDSMRPFFQQLKKRTLPADILKFATEIADAALQREYIQAMDSYMKLAIGNAAWPIGVSAVGLHERAAREKVGEGKQAHVMHNEQQRKYVTTMKRLLTYCQGKYPGDPSKMFVS